MNAYFLFQFGSDVENRVILERPSEAEIENMKAGGWVIWNISYKLRGL
jgi:hypothetical protein